jgi:hypothetical protein
MAIDLNILQNLSGQQALDYVRANAPAPQYAYSGGEGGGSEILANPDITDFMAGPGGGLRRFVYTGRGNEVMEQSGYQSNNWYDQPWAPFLPVALAAAAAAAPALGAGAGAAGSTGASGIGALGGFETGLAGLEAAGAGAGAITGGSGLAGAAGGGGPGLLSSMSLVPQGSIPSLTGAAALGKAGAALPMLSATSAGAAGTAAAAGAPLLGGINPWIAGGLQLASSLLQSSTAGRASAAQAGAAQAGIDEQRRQYEETQRLLAPYVSAGVPAVRQMQALSGALGPEAERAAIAQIEASPTLQAAVDRGETALLQRASATGGLRGGNIQAALAQFRPQMLSQEIQSRLGQFGGLATLGSNAAARQGTFGATTAGNIGNLLGTQGQAQAGGIIGETAPYASLLNIPLQLASLSASTGRPVF